MVEKEKTNLYLLSIVTIVAVVGIVVLVLNSDSGQLAVVDDETNVVGAATKSYITRMQNSFREIVSTKTEEAKMNEIKAKQEERNVEGIGGGEAGIEGESEGDEGGEGEGESGGGETEE